MSPSRKWGSSRLTSTSEPKRRVPPDLGGGVAPAPAAAGVALALAADDSVTVVDGATGAQDARTSMPRPEANNPSALRRLSSTICRFFDITKRYMIGNILATLNDFLLDASFVFP